MALQDPYILLQKVLDSYEFIYYGRQNMVSGQQVEYSIHPTPTIPTLVGVWNNVILIKMINLTNCLPILAS